MRVASPRASPRRGRIVSVFFGLWTVLLAGPFAQAAELDLSAYRGAAPAGNPSPGWTVSSTNIGRRISFQKIQSLSGAVLMQRISDKQPRLSRQGIAIRYLRTNSLRIGAGGLKYGL